LLLCRELTFEPVPQLALLAGHGKWVWDCVFSVDAAYLVTASSDCTARLWDLSSGDAIRVYSGHHKVWLAIRVVSRSHSSLCASGTVQQRRYPQLPRPSQSGHRPLIQLCPRWFRVLALSSGYRTAATPSACVPARRASLDAMVIQTQARLRRALMVRRRWWRAPLTTRPSKARRAATPTAAEDPARHCAYGSIARSAAS